jgi:hypothetical protein
MRPNKPAFAISALIAGRERCPPFGGLRERLEPDGGEGAALVEDADEEEG